MPEKQVAEGDFWYFLKWFLLNRYAFLEHLVDRLHHVTPETDQEALERRTYRAIRHGKRMLVVRLVVTVLLLLAGGSAFVSTLVAYLHVVPGAEQAVQRVTTVAASAVLLLIILRFAIERHLDRVTTYVTFMSMRIATAPHHALHGTEAAEE